ncbi:hypothetical protein DPMN_148390 [Dreissena polymorpha]|uniref:Uncharacterized protein n=1 Tax=Dreissena polymorpha TaxID=45954 RepID=A0A9D4FFF8_DREPO|nr:hypothetical protein DPMN_148390 [Dreissena polymorpha]
MDDELQSTNEAGSILQSMHHGREINPQLMLTVITDDAQSMNDEGSIPQSMHHGTLHHIKTDTEMNDEPNGVAPHTMVYRRQIDTSQSMTGAGSVDMMPQSMHHGRDINPQTARDDEPQSTNEAGSILQSMHHGREINPQLMLTIMDDDAQSMNDEVSIPQSMHHGKLYHIKTDTE